MPEIPSESPRGKFAYRIALKKFKFAKNLSFGETGLGKNNSIRKKLAEVSKLKNSTQPFLARLSRNN